jgi:catechol 2,3-dioxygenase-like lactoylglutathione lyase family enzyme
MTWEVKMANAASERAPAGIHSIDHFALTLPDLDQARHFIAAFGLRVEPGDDELRLRASGSEHVWARILPGTKKALAYLSLGCFETDFEALKAQIAGAGGERAMPHPRADNHGYWFHDPDGNLVQLKVARKTQP